jgi:rod shape-determining protein MreB
MSSILRKIISRPNMAIDLGTANTRIYAFEQDMITEEPSLVRNIRQDKDNNTDADAYIAYLNSRLASFPLRGGVVVDVNSAVKLLKPLFKRVNTGLRRPVSLACAPTDTSEKERNLLAEAIISAGCSHVAIIPEPWAAAIGAGIDPKLPSSQLLIDIGEGVTDMAVIRDGRFIFTSAIRTACYDIHKAVRTAIISRYRVFVYPSDIERLTHKVETILESKTCPLETITVKGMDIVRRCEVAIEVSNMEIISAIEPVIYKILKMIETSLGKLPENIYHEISESGICLTGGGSCIKGMERILSLRTNLKVKTAPDPTHAVIKGASQTLKYWEKQEFWWKNIVWPISSS